MFTDSSQLFFSALLVVQVIAALTIIVLVLLQQGKGADMGSAFGGGASGSLFGAAGAANFLSRVTKWAAVVFFLATVGLAYVGHQSTSGGTITEGVMEGFEAPDLSVPQLPGAGSNSDAAIPAPVAPQNDAGIPAPASTPAPAADAPAADVPAAAPSEAPAQPEAPAAPAESTSQNPGS